MKKGIFEKNALIRESRPQSKNKTLKKIVWQRQNNEQGKEYVSYVE